MLEQKKLPILEALAAFGIGGIFTAACMAGLAYLMANQSLAQSTAWPMVSAIVVPGAFAAAGSWLFSITAEGSYCGAIQGGLFVLLLLGFGLSEGIEPTEMQAGPLCTGVRFWLSGRGVQHPAYRTAPALIIYSRKIRRTGKYVGLSGNTGSRSGKGTARSDHADSTGRAVKQKNRGVLPETAQEERRSIPAAFSESRGNTPEKAAARRSAS